MPVFNFSRLNNKHFLSLAGNGILAVLGILTYKLLYHSLSLVEVGVWFYFFNIQGICDAVRNGFLGTATVKFYAGTEPERATRVLGSVWLLAFGMTLVLLVLNAGAFFFFGFSNNAELAITIKWLGITFLSTLPFSVIFWKLQADEDYLKILILRLINSGSMIIVFIILIVLGKMTLEAALLYNFLTNCLTSIAGIFLGWGRVRTIFKHKRDHINELFHFGKYSLATSVSSTMFRAADGFIIVGMLGPAALAIYSLPVKLMEIVEFPLRSFVATGMSSMAVAFNSKKMDQVTYLMKKYSGMLTIAFIPLAITGILFSNAAITLLGDQKLLTTPSPFILRCLLVISLMYPIERFNGVTLDIIHKPNLNLYKVLIMLSAVVVFDIAGIYALNNIYGIILGAFFSIFIGLLFGYFQLTRYVSYSIADILRVGSMEMKIFLKKNLKL